jgi:membrane protein implicated in regulation of membrane protease activity
LVWKFLTGGLFLLGLGLLIVVFPELLAIPVSLLCFVGAAFLFMGAWRVFWASRRMEQPAEDYEDASFYEIEE